MDTIIYTIFFILCGIGFLLTTGVIFVVEQQSVAIIERFGKFVGIAKAGLNFKLPAPISIIAKRANLRITQSEHMLYVKTQDNTFISLPIKIQIRIIEDKVAESFYKLNSPIAQIDSLILNTVRSKSATLTFEEVYTKKNDIAEEVTIALKAKVESYGYEIIEVLVDEPEPSHEVQKSYNNVIASKRDLEAAKNHAEAKKVLLIGEAQAEAESLELKAISYAKQRKVISKGVKEAFEEVQDNNIDCRYLLEYLSGIDYRDTIRDAARSNSNTLIFSNNPQDDMMKILPNIVSDKKS